MKSIDTRDASVKTLPNPSYSSSSREEKTVFVFDGTSSKLMQTSFQKPIENSPTSDVPPT